MSTTSSGSLFLSWTCSKEQTRTLITVPVVTNYGDMKESREGECVACSCCHNHHQYTILPALDQVLSILNVFHWVLQCLSVPFLPFTQNWSFLPQETSSMPWHRLVLTSFWEGKRGALLWAHSPSAQRQAPLFLESRPRGGDWSGLYFDTRSSNLQHIEGMWPFKQKSAFGATKHFLQNIKPWLCRCHSFYSKYPRCPVGSILITTWKKSIWSH